MRNKEVITQTKGDSSGSIDELIDFLTKAKEKGATHYLMYWSNDMTWAFKWFETYRIKSEEEMIEDEIKKLESKLNSLKKKN
jgi:hypothetical protein